MGVHRVFLIFSISSLVSPVQAQVIIKEQLRIDPKAQIKPQPFSAPSGPLLRLRGSILETTMPGVVVSGSLSVLPSVIPENTGYEVWVSAGGASHLIRKTGSGYCLDSGGGEFSPFPVTLKSCGVIGMSAITYVPAPWQWSCAVRGTAIDTPSVDGNSAVLTAHGTLWYTEFNAVLAITASLDESYFISEVVAVPAVESLTCNSMTGVEVTVLDGHGNAYTGCSGAQLTGTATIQAKGGYAFLEGSGESGKTVNFSINNGKGAFFVVLDTSKGIIDGGSDVARISVQVEGRVGNASVAMSCNYPPPTVAITYPGSDTTITLSPDHLPTIIFTETHTPEPGKQFEPSISWSPGPFLATKEYFEKIQDSLVVPVKATATNAGGTASDELEIILKRECSISPPHYRQGDPKWANTIYDNTKDSIKTLGCALSCMAMAMTAFGDSVNPLGLNTWMTGRTLNDGGYNGANVNWNAINKHNNLASNSLPENVDTSFNISAIDPFLAECELIIAKVFNAKSVEKKPKEVQERKKREGNHWVLVVRKAGSSYAILDPGRGLTDLSDYGRIYRYVRVSRN